jgi:hypothetical protein
VTASIKFRALDSLEPYKVVFCKSDLATTSAHLLVDQPPPFFMSQANRAGYGRCIALWTRALSPTTFSDDLFRELSDRLPSGLECWLEKSPWTARRHLGGA